MLRFISFWYLVLKTTQIEIFAARAKEFLGEGLFAAKVCLSLLLEAPTFVTLEHPQKVICLWVNTKTRRKTFIVDLRKTLEEETVIDDAPAVANKVINCITEMGEDTGEVHSCFLSLNCGFTTRNLLLPN